MNIDSIWNSLKNEDGLPFVKGGIISCCEAKKPFNSISLAHQIIGRPFDVDDISVYDLTKLSPSKNENRDRRNGAVDVCSDLFGGLDAIHETSIANATCEDSDDEDQDAEETEPPQSVSNTSWRIERIAKALVGDDQSTRVQTLSKLKDAIDTLLVNLSAPPQLNYPPPYDNDHVELRGNLHLVSDFIKLKLLEDTNIPRAQRIPCRKMHRDADESLGRLQAIFNSCGNSLFLVIGDVNSEKCRALATGCLQSLLLAGIDVRRHIPYMIPALRARLQQCTYDKDMEVFVQDHHTHEFYKRGGATDRQDRHSLSSKVIEHNEELRLELCRTFNCLVRGILAVGAERTLDAYYADIVFSIQTNLRDPLPELKIEASYLLVQLMRIPHWEPVSKYFATGLARSALLGCRHRNTNVIIAAIALFEASVCVPDRAKKKGAGTAAISDLVGFREENVLPVAAFYESKCNVSVNTLAELASHTNHRIRLRCCEMLSYFMVYLPDRYDHQQRLLPYVLSFVDDDIPNIREVALDCIEKCGLQYEYEHPEDVIERRQFGIDGDDTTDYDRGLPESFPRRPSLGARLFVRANASRFFLALLGELSNWKGHIRHRSAKVLLILTVYCEEHLTKDFHHTIASIAKAIGMDISSQGEGDSMMKLEPIRQVLRLMAKYVDPAAYLPLLCPRILGDNSSATSDSRRNYAIALSSLIEGSPIHRLTLHWSDVASLLSDTDCIGPFVGTQTRRQCLTAFHTLIAMVTTSKGCAASFVAQLADEGELDKLRSVLSSSNAALEEMMRKVSGCDEDAKLGRGCIDGISEIVAAAATEV